MLIKVTQVHIDNGCRLSCSQCPIALAIYETSALIRNVRVRKITTFTDLYHGDKAFKLPDEALEFIQKFDSGLKVEPFEFTLGV